VINKANSIAIPVGFNARDPASVAAALASLPVNGLDSYSLAQSGGANLIGPALIIEQLAVASGPVIQVVDYNYGLTLPAESFELATGGLLEATEEIINPESYEIFAGSFVIDIVFIPFNEITYTQSSLYFANTAASAETMIDGEIGGSATGTNFDSLAWVKMDLGAEYLVDRIIIGTATSTMPGGWDKSYTENASIEFSTNDLEWTTAADTQTFNAEGIFVFNVSFAARYIRLARQSGYIAVTEFYALAPQQLLFNAEA
jgi:hypothetical protein